MTNNIIAKVVFCFDLTPLVGGGIDVGSYIKNFASMKRLIILVADTAVHVALSTGQAKLN